MPVISSNLRIVSAFERASGTPSGSTKRWFRKYELGTFTVGMQQPVPTIVEYMEEDIESRHFPLKGPNGAIGSHSHYNTIYLGRENLSNK